ncbi:hypothetical protein EC957_012302 [Mortierella hygrophila]|uniref:Uncharacterized protein n=1 Tax=Mortierella hygrophila TaxID=979708 RepID=A0A9P6F6S2_9FUNG|nr:hypothetical protein EC957_012302 [Mortierella hygrophila]
MAELDSHRRLSVVFDSDDNFKFECKIGDLNMSERFSKYYEESIAKTYDPDNFQDFLYAHREEMRRGGAESARWAIRKLIREAEESPLTELLHCASRLGNNWKATTESDQTSGFILWMLEPFFNRPDTTRLAHSATTSSSGSPYIRLCANFDTKPQPQDMRVRHEEKRDISVSEVSLERGFANDRGDLSRIALLAKRMLDQLITTFSGLDKARIIFFQVIRQTCEFYQMTRCETVCVANRIGCLTIAYTLNDVLKGFEDDCRTWITVCNVFQSWGS